LQRVSFKSDLDIALRSIENDLSSRYDKIIDEKNLEITKQLEKSIDLLDENEIIETELDNLHIQLEEKNFLLNNLKENELFYQNEISNLKRQLTAMSTETFSSCVFQLREKNEPNISFFSENEQLRKVNETVFQRLNTKLIGLLNEMKNQTSSSIDSKDDSFKDKYNKLKIAIENMSFISVNEIRNELEQHFYQVYKIIKYFNLIHSLIIAKKIGIR
jgi:hypothetical protein